MVWFGDWAAIAACISATPSVIVIVVVLVIPKLLPLDVVRSVGTGKAVPQ
jgi:hypothetical protein